MMLTAKPTLATHTKNREFMERRANLGVHPFGLYILVKRSERSAISTMVEVCRCFISSIARCALGSNTRKLLTDGGCDRIVLVADGSRNTEAQVYRLLSRSTSTSLCLVSHITGGLVHILTQSNPSPAIALRRGRSHA